MNQFQSLLLQLASAQELPNLVVAIDWQDDEPLDYHDVKDLSTHAAIWDDVQSMEATVVTFQESPTSDDYMGRMMVLPYEGEDMIGDWTLGRDTRWEGIVDKAVLHES